MDWPAGSHASTFCGNPVACAAALATLDVIEEGNLLANATAMGERLQAGLRALAEEHEAIGEVRGLGLMVGIELVADRESREPAKDLRNRVIRKCFERGVLLLGCGKSVIRFIPPLNVAAHEIDLGLEILAGALKEAEGVEV